LDLFSTREEENNSPECPFHGVILVGSGDFILPVKEGAEHWKKKGKTPPFLTQSGSPDI
jgi:hypothetical protein